LGEGRNPKELATACESLAIACFFQTPQEKLEAKPAEFLDAELKVKF
jgi:hypothetical protein